MNTNRNSEPMRELRSDEVDTVAGGIEISIGFLTVSYYGRDSETGAGKGPLGDGVDLPLVWQAQIANSTRHKQAF